MKNKKGFTLVELLAVIAILAILVIIALPNVMGMFNQAKENSFTTELRQIYKVAQQTWISDSMLSTAEQVYTRCATCNGKQLSLSGRGELDYYIKINKAGQVVKFSATDGTYQFNYDGDLLATQINNVEQVANLGEDDTIKIINDTVKKGPIVIKEFCITTNSSPSATNFDYYQYEDGMTIEEWFASDYNPQKPNLFMEFWYFYDKEYYTCTVSCNKYIHDDYTFNTNLDTKLIDKSMGCYFNNDFQR